MRERARGRQCLQNGGPAIKQAGIGNSHPPPEHLELIRRRFLRLVACCTPLAQPTLAEAHRKARALACARPADSLRSYAIARDMRRWDGVFTGCRGQS